MRQVMRTLRLLWQLTLPSLRRQPPAAGPGLRRDPAPTVWSYRYQRLMLTPAWRRMVRVGLPMLVAAMAATAWLAQAGNRERLAGAWESAVDQVTERPQFMVARVEVAGADRVLAEAIRETLALDLPLSSFDLDLDGLRDRVTALTAVREARLRVATGGPGGGALVVEVDQRVPVAVWRYADGLRLIDAEGAMTGMIASRADRSDLPLIAGDGARDAIGEALALFAAAAPIAPRVRGLVRMGERRWDMVLDGEARILLPTQGAVAALERVVALHQAQKLLDRDLSVVDVRLGGRPTIRLGQPALNVLRNLQSVAAEAPRPPIPEEN